MKRHLNLLVVVIAICAFSTAAFAGTQATNTNTVAPTLQIQANIQKAIRLTLSTGTSTAAHCAVTSGTGTDYSMDFGTVDALAINTPTCGGVFPPTNPGTDPAIYWSDYDLKPVFTSQSSNSGTITARVTTNFTNANVAVLRDTANSASVPASGTQFTAMGVAAADQIATGVTSGNAVTRFIGVEILPANGAGAPTGVQNATVTFTLTVN